MSSQQIARIPQKTTIKNRETGDIITVSSVKEKETEKAVLIRQTISSPGAAYNEERAFWIPKSQLNDWEIPEWLAKRTRGIFIGETDLALIDCLTAWECYAENDKEEE